MTETSFIDPMPAALREGVSLFGAGRFARDVAAALRARGVAVHAFLTSGAPAQPLLDGLPWRQADAAALAASPVWVGVFNYQAFSDYDALRRTLSAMQPAARLVWPQAFYGSLADALGFRFWLQASERYAAEEAEIGAARELFEDETSRSLYDAIHAFRSQPVHHARPPAPQGETHYLPAWLQTTLRQNGMAPLRIVDAGAYQGETLRELAELVPVEQAWAFEPDAGSYAAMTRAMADWPLPVTMIPAGLSDRSGVVAFTPGEGESSSVNEQGTHHVPVVALDDCLHGARVNFMKFDVEGHELAALAGARGTLQKHRPTLAVAGYHRWDDLWLIPQFIHGLGLDYRIRIGLHQHNSFETVFYAY